MLPNGSSADVVFPYNEDVAVNGVLVVPYWKSKKNTRPEGRFIGCTETNSLDDYCPNTFLTNGRATPAHCPPVPAVNLPVEAVPPPVCELSTTSCLA